MSNSESAVWKGPDGLSVAETWAWSSPAAYGKILESVGPVSETVCMLPTQNIPWTSLTPHHKFVFTLSLVLIFSDSAQFR